MSAAGSDVRLPFIAHPCVVLGGLSVAGSVAPGAPGAAALVALGWIVLGAAALRRGALGAGAGGLRGMCWGVVIAAASFFVVGIRAERALEHFEDERVAARDHLGPPQRCAAVVRITDSPTVRTMAATPAPALPVQADTCDTSSAPGADRPTERSVNWSGTTEFVDCEHVRLRGPLQLRISGGPEDLARGDVVEVVAGLGPTQLFRNAGLPDPTPNAARRGAVLSGSALVVAVLRPGTSLYSSIDRARAFVRRRIEATYPAVVAPLGRALVLGENDLPDDDAAAFSRSGLLHLLAVSGTHLVIAVLALVHGMRALLVRIGPLARRYDLPRLSAFVGALLSLLYADFAGGSGSAWRAAYMLCAVLGARAFGFRVSGRAALGVSLLVGTALDPLAGSDLSFLLSALATAGLIGLGRPLASWVERGPFAGGILNKLALSLVATLSSTIPCSPALALMDGQMTAAALLANVVAGPLGEILALPACLLHAVASPWPAAERGLGLVGAGALYGVRAVALWSAAVESAQFNVPLPSSFDIATLALGALGLAAWPLALSRERNADAGECNTVGRLGWPKTIVWVLAVLGWVGVLATRHGAEPRELRVTALDVGQGDALALEFPDGQLAFVDGGGFPTGIPDPGTRVLVPFARSLRRSHLDLVVLSHAHPDHLLGLFSAAAKLPVRELWHPSGAAPEFGPYAELLRSVRAGGGRVLGPAELCGKTRSIGGATLEVLAPCPGAAGWGANDESLVVRVGFGRRSVLLSGDIEQLGERRLVETYGRELRADLLKVPHHGSHTSSSAELLALVQPRWAIISSGVRNRFDHPRQITLDRLSASGAGVLRTDRSGSITFRTDGNVAELWAFSAPR